MLQDSIISFSNIYTTIKKQLSSSLEIDQNHLNEISMEDVRIAESAKENINQIIADMLFGSTPKLKDAGEESKATPDDVVPCISFWVEQTKDLVVFICTDNMSEAIIVPENGWGVRSDRTIH